MNFASIYRSSFFKVSLVCVLLISGGFLQLFESEESYLNALVSVLLFIIYSAPLLYWGYSIHRRMVCDMMKKYLIAVASLMVFWIFIRTIKYEPFSDIDGIARCLWYFYYIPIILIPQCGLYIALHIGKEGTWKLPKKYYLFLISSLALIIGIITNDHHQLAFGFLADFKNWSGDYSHKILYFLAMFWILALLLATILILYKKSYIPYTKKRLWMPFAVIGVGIIYTVLYILDHSDRSIVFIEMTPMLCALTVALWESYIKSGLIPSNTMYKDFFNVSSTKALITDKEGNIVYRSNFSKELSKEDFELLKAGQSVQIDDNSRLYAETTRGGYAIWQENIGEITSKVDLMQIIRIQLEEGLVLIEKDIEARARRAQVDEKNRLYDLTLNKTMPQLTMIKEYLDLMERVDQGEQVKILSKINRLGIYIKQRNNLALIGEGQKTVTILEMRRSFLDLFDNFKKSGIEGRLRMPEEGRISAKDAVDFYDFLQLALEEGPEDFAAISIDMFDRSGKADKPYEPDREEGLWEIYIETRDKKNTRLLSRSLFLKGREE